MLRQNGGYWGLSGARQVLFCSFTSISHCWCYHLHHHCQPHRISSILSVAATSVGIKIEQRATGSNFATVLLSPPTSSHRMGGNENVDENLRPMRTKRLIKDASSYFFIFYLDLFAPCLSRFKRVLRVVKFFFFTFLKFQ